MLLCILKCICQDCYCFWLRAIIAKIKKSVRWLLFLTLLIDHRDIFKLNVKCWIQMFRRDMWQLIINCGVHQWGTDIPAKTSDTCINDRFYIYIYIYIYIIITIKSAEIIVKIQWRNEGPWRPGQESNSMPPPPLGHSTNRIDVISVLM